MIIFILITAVVVNLTSLWVILEKAGKPGWGSLIPVYNVVLILQIIKYPLWILLLFPLPLINMFAYALMLYNLGRKFRQADGFCMGLALLAPLFLPLLALRTRTAPYDANALTI